MFLYFQNFEVQNLNHENYVESIFMELVHNREKVEIGLEKSTTLTFMYYGIYPSISRLYTSGRLGGGIWGELMNALL